MLQIHEKIKQARETAGLTEGEVADKIGIKRSTYQYWEKKTPLPDKIKLVETALNLPENYFYDEKLITDEKSVREIPSKNFKNQNEKSLHFLIESNDKLVETNLKLTAMLEKAMAPTVSDQREILQDVPARLQAVQELLIELGKGKALWKTNREGAAILHKHIYGEAPAKNVTDTQKNLGKQRKAFP